MTKIYYYITGSKKRSMRSWRNGWRSNESRWQGFINLIWVYLRMVRESSFWAVSHQHFWWSFRWPWRSEERHGGRKKNGSCSYWSATKIQGEGLVLYSCYSTATTSNLLFFPNGVHTSKSSQLELTRLHPAPSGPSRRFQFPCQLQQWMLCNNPAAASCVPQHTLNTILIR